MVKSLQTGISSQRGPLRSSNTALHVADGETEDRGGTGSPVYASVSIRAELEHGPLTPVLTPYLQCSEFLGEEGREINSSPFYKQNW